MTACRWCGAPRAETPRYACDKYCAGCCSQKRHEHDCERGWKRAAVFARHKLSRNRTACLYDVSIIAVDPLTASLYGSPAE